MLCGVAYRGLAVSQTLSSGGFATHRDSSPARLIPQGTLTFAIQNIENIFWRYLNYLSFVLAHVEVKVGVEGGR